MDYCMQADIHRVVVETLTELGKPLANLSCLNLRILIRDGYYVGHTIEYEGIRVVLLAGGNLIEFYGEGGTLLRAVGIDRERPDTTAAA